MALLYILLALGVIVIHIDSVPEVFRSIVEGAFSSASDTARRRRKFFLSMKRRSPRYLLE